MYTFSCIKYTILELWLLLMVGVTAYPTLYYQKVFGRM